METLSETEYKEQYPVVGTVPPDTKAEIRRKTWQPRDVLNNDVVVQTVDASVDAAISSETPEHSSSATMASTQALNTTTADGVSLMNPPSSAKEKTLAALSSSEMLGHETKNDEMVQTVDASIDAALSETPEPSNATTTSTQQINTTATDWVSEVTGMNITNEQLTELMARHEAASQESRVLAWFGSEKNSHIESAEQTVTAGNTGGMEIGVAPQMEGKKHNTSSNSTAPIANQDPTAPIANQDPTADQMMEIDADIVQTTKSVVETYSSEKMKSP